MITDLAISLAQEIQLRSPDRFSLPGGPHRGGHETRGTQQQRLVLKGYYPMSSESS